MRWNLIISTLAFRHLCMNEMISGFQRAPLWLRLTEQKNIVAVIDKKRKEGKIRISTHSGKTLRAPIHLANSSCLFVIYDDSRFRASVSNMKKGESFYTSSLEYWLWNFFSQPARVEELTKTNSKEMLMVCLEGNALRTLSSFSHNWIFFVGFAIVLNLFWLAPDWTDQKFLFSFMTTVLSIEILIALRSIQQSMMWQILNKNLLYDSQNRAIM